MLIYRGPSMLDGAPIVAIATGLDRPSRNSKTGPVVQVWILRADKRPVDASMRGLDSSICGMCPHRQSLGGACYVNLAKAPTNIYVAFKAGKYGRRVPKDITAPFAGLVLRLGAYGDPAAVPASVWARVTAKAKSWLGYTHQWMQPKVQVSGLARYCMASCDSPRDLFLARAKGWRTFRVRTANAPVLPGEFICPASEEAGYKRTCATCGACNGNTRPKAVSPVIVVHGAVAKRFSDTTLTAA